MRDYHPVDVPPPNADGLQAVVLPYRFSAVSSVGIKANNDGQPVRATAQAWGWPAEADGFIFPADTCLVTLAHTDSGRPVAEGSIGLIVEHR